MNNPIATAKRLWSATSGHFAMMTAIMTPVAITLAAFAVDVGSLHVEKRHAQALADLAALSAAANIDKADQAALTAMTDNGAGEFTLVAATPKAAPVGAGTVGRIVVERGRYAGDPGLSPRERFKPDVAPFNAARVTYHTTGRRWFAGALIPPPQIAVSATASTSTEAAFSVGSRLAALDGGIVNALLGGLLGANISLSAMDYDALAGADVRLLAFLDALAVDLDLTAATYAQVLDTEVTVGRAARALSKTDGIDGNAKAALGKLAQQAGGASAPKLRLSRLIGLGETGGQVARAGVDRLSAEIGVLELLGTSAIVAGNGRQVALNLGAGVPGLLSLAVDLAVGEPPQHSQWFGVGSGGELVRTAQTRLALTAQVGGLLGVNIRIPLYLELAFAEARLKSVACPSGRPDSARVTVEARPGVASLFLAEVDPSKIAGFANPAPLSPARVLQVPLLVNVTGQAHAEIADTGYTQLIFTAADKVKRVSTRQFTGSLTQSLFSGLSLNVSVIGLGLGLPGNLTGQIGDALGAAAPDLDKVLTGLLSTLGLSLGQADIRVHGVDCGRAVLVQ